MNIDKIIGIIRDLKEEAPTINLGSGQIAGTVEAGDDPPVDLRNTHTKGWNIFFRGLVKDRRKNRNRKNK